MIVHIMSIKVGDRLAADVFNRYGLPVLSANTVLDERDIDKLRNHGIEYADIAFRNDADETWSPDGDGIRRYVETLTRSHQPRFDQAVSGIRTLFEQVSIEGAIDERIVRESFDPLVEKLSAESDVVSLLLSLNSKDDYTYSHSVQVGMICYFLTKWLGYKESDALTASKAGFLHDIGKSLIDEAILKKPSKLTPEEYEEIKRHTTLGAEIITKSMGANIFANVALQHHERLNGSGYPYGIKGGAIHQISKICAVADTYSAMISSRVYQQKRHLLVVLEELHRLSFAELEPSVTQTFIRHMLPNFIGKKVIFKDGDVGHIVMMNPTTLFQPLVKIGNKFLDLSTDAGKQIEMIYL